MVRRAPLAPFTPFFLRLAGRLAANRRRRRRRNVRHTPIRRPAPEPLPPVNELGMDLIRHIFLRCDVSTVVVARLVSRWSRTELETLQFANDYREVVRPGFGDKWTITHHRFRKDDRVGWIRMATHNPNGSVSRVRQFRFDTQYRFLVERNLVGVGETMILIGTFQNFFTFRLTLSNNLQALLLFNLTSPNSSFRVDCRWHLFRRSGNFKIAVDPNDDNSLYLQYFQENDSVLTYFEYRFRRDGWRADGWNVRVIHMVGHLLPGEAQHPLAMGTLQYFITFRGGIPIYVRPSLFIPATPGDPAPFGYLGVGAYHSSGSASYVIVFDVAYHIHQGAIRGIVLYRLNPNQRYEMVSRVPENLYPPRNCRLMNFEISMVDSTVCFAITLVKRRASGYLIYCYDTIYGLWSRFLDDDFSHNDQAGSTFVSRLSL